ncbi:ABC transporter permease subunit [Gayadomonas joobiniege]|uniref:ABC transporter permease subunit n=1 Tax=Gayadomonas joobiniege TaxID=1234606 RepID=UPI000369DA47|nr:ABC transporter permease subunit [Gayadomonas joobiniege]
MANNNIYDQNEYPGPYQLTWSKFKSDHPAWVCFYLVMGFIFVALFAPLIAPYSAMAQHPEATLLPPSWQTAGDVSFLLGTDDLGRDLLSRLIYGAQITFGLSLLVALVAMIIGVALGALAGASKGLKSSVFNHFFDTILSIPSLLLAIIIVAVLGPGLSNTIWAVLLVLVPQFVHSTRIAIQAELKKEYVTAARLDGANEWQILKNSVFPNIVETLILQYTLAVSTAIIDIAALGFLGLGAQQGSPEWGAMLSESIDLIYRASWLITLPGVTMFLSLLSVNTVGHGLRHALKSRSE